MTGFRRFSRLLLAALCLLAGFSSAWAATMLKAGDRVVIYGDSITEQRLYSRYLQQYLFCRYPELKLTVFNAGWGGDTAPGALNRLDRDVLSLKPTVVTLFFGMNDGGYGGVNQDLIDRYRTNLENIIKALQEKNVRVVVFTPGCVDPDKNQGLKDKKYNDQLEALGVAALELAKKYDCPGVDVFHPMLEYQNARKAENAAYTMIPDSVHPNPEGHMLMASIMLKGFSVDPMPALGEYDVAKNTGDGLRLLTKDKDARKIELAATRPMLLPYWFDASTAQAMNVGGFLDTAGQKLTVRGLTGAYSVQVGQDNAGVFKASQLAAGVMIPGSNSQRGKLLHDTVMRKEYLYFSAWREIKLGLAALPDVQQIFDSLLDADSAFHASIWKLTAPAADVTITLVSVPEGANLAKGKPYVCSDPNAYGWGGTATLTDGSWDESATSCFATNNADKFPKTVTIDLGQATMVNAASFGVPSFGSTKTVKVALSENGTDFTEVGSNVFTQKKAERYILRFNPTKARYVQLIYPDYYTEVVGYDKYFSFTTEVEVYGPVD